MVKKITIYIREWFKRHIADQAPEGTDDFNIWLDRYK